MVELFGGDFVGLGRLVFMWEERFYGPGGLGEKFFYVDVVFLSVIVLVVGCCCA